MTIPEALNILELKTPVKKDDIRKAFRVQARLHHPDKFSDPDSQKAAALRFIRVKNAYDYLLSLTIEQINSGRFRPQLQILRKTDRKPIYRQTSPLIRHPLVNEIDRLAQLFNLINKQGQKTLFWKKVSAFRFTPVEWLGEWYTKLIEKKYPGEERMSGFLFFIFRLFRLVSAAIFLIIGFFFMALSAMGIMIITAPPVFLFIAIYHLYANALIWIEKKKVKLLPGVSNSDLQYLILRTLPMIAWVALAKFMILSGRNYSFYFQSFSWIFSTLLCLLLLNIGSDWVLFFKGKSFRK